MTEGRQVALVTGASRGIGRAIAGVLGRQGMLVIVHYGRRREGAEETVRAIEAAGGAAFAVGANVSRPDEVDALFDTIDRELAARGHDKLDVLVNNAAIGGGGDLSEASDEVLSKLFDTNVKGLMWVTRRAVPRLRDGGRIINLSSMVSLAAYPDFITYAMTKAAVNSFTRSLAAGLGKRGITVNAVAPGATATDFIRPILEDPELSAYYTEQAALRRIGEPEDIADVVGFLASPAGRWVTGQVIQTSGGTHL